MAIDVATEVENERFVMATTDGPFAMETTYSWTDAADGSTRMLLRTAASPPASPGSSPR